MMGDEHEDGIGFLGGGDGVRVRRDVAPSEKGTGRGEQEEPRGLSIGFLDR